MKNFVKYNFLNQRLDFQDSKPNPWKSFSEHVPPIALVVAMAVLYWILPPPPSLKKILFWGQMGNFGLIVTQNYTSIYLRICSKDFFKICSIIGHSKQMKFTQVKFPKKSSFGSESFDHLESTVPFVLILFLMFVRVVSTTVCKCDLTDVQGKPANMENLHLLSFFI